MLGRECTYHTVVVKPARYFNLYVYRCTNIIHFVYHVLTVNLRHSYINRDGPIPMRLARTADRRDSAGKLIRIFGHSPIV
jgi:hypothetical protein